MEAKAISHVKVLIETYNCDYIIGRSLLIYFGRPVHFEKMQTTIAELV